MAGRPEHRILVALLLGGLPAVLLAGLALWRLPGDPLLRGGAWLAAVAAWLACAAAVRSRAAFHLRTVGNLLAALREGDYSFRARRGGRGDAWGELILELNQLAETLREERAGGVEASALLGKVMAEIDVAVFACDPEGRLQLVNRAGERLLGASAAQVTGRKAVELGLGDALAGAPERAIALDLPGGGGRFELRRGRFRQHGRPHTLLVLSDVSRTLRAEELEAWKRIIRVIGHELNNSLAPITSLAGSLARRSRAAELPAELAEDLREGLGIIGDRAEALNRFMGAYAALAKVPVPLPRPVDVASWVRRVAALESRRPVEVEAGPEVALEADVDQLDQLLINLVRNAVDAMEGRGGRVWIEWSCARDWLEVRVVDDGPGLPPSANLFVPFFTTKPGGSGIGLVLCRQVAEAHGGSVALANREQGAGCVATVRLPLRPPLSGRAASPARVPKGSVPPAPTPPSSGGGSRSSP